MLVAVAAPTPAPFAVSVLATALALPPAQPLPPLNPTSPAPPLPVPPAAFAVLLESLLGDVTALAAPWPAIGAWSAETICAVDA